MDAAGRHVGRDQGGDLAVLELLQGAVALRLGAAAVQRRGADAVGEEPLGEPVGGALGVHEHDHAAVTGGDAQGDRLLVGVVGDVEHVVLHGRHGARRGVDGVHHRVGEVAAHQPVDVAVQGGGEEHPLPVGGGAVQQGGDLRHESHVGHLVGLVQDADGHLVEAAVAPVQEVLEPPRRGDDDLGAAAQGARLLVQREPADDGGHAQPEGLGVRREGVGDLLGQFAGRDEDQGERCPGLGAASGGAGQQGEAEGEGLAGAGAAPAEDVAAGQRVGERRGLDGERLGHALGGQRGEQRLGQLQLGEGGDGRQGRGARLGEGEVAALRGGGGAGGGGAPGPSAPSGASGAAAAGVLAGAAAGAGLGVPLGRAVPRCLAVGAFGSSHGAVSAFLGTAQTGARTERGAGPGQEVRVGAGISRRRCSPPAGPSGPA